MNTIKKSFLITLVTLSVFPSSVLAVTYKPTITVQTQTTSKTPTTIKPGNAMMVAKVEYLLPYPGILPDNPLYFLKAARDKIIEFLIADPVRKAEFYILQSDKRLGMTSMLLEKGNTTLAETTLSKGETYMEKTISTLVNYKASGKEIPGYLLDRLTRSIAKHIEVLTDLFAKATDPMKTALANAIAQAQKLQGEAAKLK